MNKILLLLSALLTLSACTQHESTGVAGQEAAHPEPAPRKTAADANTAPVQPVSPEQVAKAALDGNAALIEQALKSGFDVDMRDSEERTSLMYAAFNGHADVVGMLLAAGADVNARDRIGSTALMFCCSGPFTQTVQLLLDHGAEVNAIDSNEHFTALMWAAAEGQTENVKLLLQHQADPSLQDIDGDTAESFAAQKGHNDIVQMLQTFAATEE